MKRRKTIFKAILTVLFFFSFFLPAHDSKAEVCGNRSLFAKSDVFWGDPPPIDQTKPIPRAYNDVTVGPADLIRFSVEGEFPGDIGLDQDCESINIEIEIYFDGAPTVPVWRVIGTTVSGIRVTGGGLGSWQWYFDWLPHLLGDGDYRFRVVAVGSTRISSFLTGNVLHVRGAGPPPPPPPPVCSVNFSPASIFIGATTIETWTSSGDADGALQYSCTGNLGAGSTTLNGSLAVAPTSTQTCTFTAINAGGTTACSATVTVTIPPPVVNLSCDGSPGPCNIPFGASSTIAWASTNATSCTGTPAALTGIFGSINSGALTTSQTYSITCTGPGGTATDTVQVNVAAASPASCTVNFSPATILTGQSTIQAWSSLNDADGMLQYSCTGNIGAGNTTLSGSASVTPTATQTCVLTAINAAGTSATCSAAVTVNPPPPAICNVSFTPATIFTGQTTIQSWTSSNDADGTLQYTCTGNIGSGSTIANGSSALTPDVTQTCSFAAVNIAGASSSCSATVTVNLAAPTVNLTCDGSLGPCSIPSGGSSTIAWASTNATSCTGTPGAISGISGSINSGPLTISQTYSISCSGPGGTVTDTVQVNVLPPPPPATGAISCNGFAGACNIDSGSAVTINWSCTNATSGLVTNSIDNVTWSGTSGVQVLTNILSTTTFTLSCTGGANTATTIATAYVLPAVPPPPIGPQALDGWIFAIPNPFGENAGTFESLLDAAVIFLYYLAGPVAVIMIILAGLLLILGRGEPTKIQRAKKILTYALIGLVIILIGRGFIALLQSIFALGQ